ncbi:MAG: class I SAM-dependent methyltransferase [Solirubrobacteraceae bacterium]
MTTIDLGRAEATAPTVSDPFAVPAAAIAPARPRLLSYVGRWGRARRWLPADALRVLDVGCAFGYGSAAIAAAGPAGQIVVGVENNPGHLERGRRDFPWVTILDADATSLPVPDGCADAVLLLDVIEHLARPADAITEAHRVLRPGGVVIISVPHRGPLRHLDALNAYTALHRRRPGWPPLEPATGSAGGHHRHFAVSELTALLAPGFTVDRVTRTGLGLEELVYLAALLARVPRGRERVGTAALLLHLAVYLIDDLAPWGPLGYNLTVRSVRRPEARP